MERQSAPNSEEWREQLSDTWESGERTVVQGIDRVEEQFLEREQEPEVPERTEETEEPSPNSEAELTPCLRPEAGQAERPTELHIPHPFRPLNPAEVRPGMEETEERRQRQTFARALEDPQRVIDELRVHIQELMMDMEEAAERLDIVEDLLQLVLFKFFGTPYT